MRLPQSMSWMVAFVPEAQLPARKADTINNKNLNFIMSNTSEDQESAFWLPRLSVSMKELNVNPLSDVPFRHSL